MAAPFLRCLSLLLVAAPAAAQPTVLMPGAARDVPLAPDGAHEYLVKSPAAHAFDITVDQGGIDLIIDVRAPDGVLVAHADSASEADGTRGLERAEVVALEGGEYRVAITAFKRSDAKPATYRITLTEPRALTAAELETARDERDLIAIERRWAKAVGAGDLPVLTSILHEKAVALGPTGRGRTQPQIVNSWKQLAAMRQERGITETHTVNDLVVRLVGDTAVSTGRYRLERRIRDGRTMANTGQFIHVWQRDARGWRIVGDYVFPYGRVEPLTASTAKGLVAPPAYAGTYEFPGSNNTLVLDLQDGKLRGTWSGPMGPGGTMQLTPATEVTMVDEAGVEFTFVRAADGQVRELLMVSDGPARRATKVR